MSTSDLHTQEFTCTYTHTHKGETKTFTVQFTSSNEPKGLGFTELLTKDRVLVC